MARKKHTGLGDEAIPTGTPGVLPKKTGKVQSCAVCTEVGPEATIQLCLRRTGKKVHRPATNHNNVCDVVRGLGNEDRESFLVLHLDARLHITDVDRVSKGSIDGVEVHPREVFKAALLNNAKGIVLAHNHPSGNSIPSRQDIELTKRLKEVGELVGIPVYDHVVVTSAECNSMVARGDLHGLSGYPTPPKLGKGGK
jgi:DNA repair protein RadC